MGRLSAIFVAVCMVVIAGSVGAVLYLRFGLGGPESPAGSAHGAAVLEAGDLGLGQAEAGQHLPGVAAGPDRR